jgi:hypothetical protein
VGGLGRAGQDRSHGEERPGIVSFFSCFSSYRRHFLVSTFSVPSSQSPCCSKAGAPNNKNMERKGTRLSIAQKDSCFLWGIGLASSDRMDVFCFESTAMAFIVDFSGIEGFFFFLLLLIHEFFPLVHFASQIQVMGAWKELEYRMTYFSVSAL